MIRIGRRWTFEAAHFLPNVPSDHKCRRTHGHSYTVEIEVEGPIETRLGWVCDFDRLDAAWAPLYTKLDHGILNDIDGLQNPTSEHLANWIALQFDQELGILKVAVQVVRVRVAETARSWAEWTPHDT